MKKIIAQAGIGKTFQLIKESHATGFHIVCINQKEAIRVHSEAKQFSFNIPLPLTFHEFINKDYQAREIKGFLIDNADMLIQELSSVPIGCITLRP